MSSGGPPAGPPAAPAPRIGRRPIWQALVLLAVVIAIVVAALVVAALVRGALLAGGALADGSANVPGLALAFTSLLLGFVFLLYSLKYYVSSISALLAAVLLWSSRNGNGNGGNGTGNGNGHGNGHGIGNGNGIGRLVDRTNGNGGNGGNGGETPLDREPFVSIHIATYNERRVLRRLLEACTALDYHNYEIVLVDDSTDETRAILAAWEGRPGLTIVRRPSRSGYKGGALAEALRRTDPRAEYVVVFDADAVPFRDAIQRFLPHFYDVNGAGNGHAAEAGPRRPRTEVAAVQSYQWHVLNKSESWLTEAVRAEYAGSYMVERPFQESVGSLKMVAGTGYMIRADVLREVGWGRSLTEDWQLTLRLYLRGYKVVYTPYAETPAECVATFSRLSRQRMRWAEGHTHTVRRAFWPALRSGRLSPIEKLEFLYYSLYYLQAPLLVIGTLSWLVAEVFLRTHVPEWTAVLGWSLLLTNLLALPVMNAAGLVLEDAPARDMVGVLGAFAITFLLVPFQTWASLKGLFERDEGPWFRTPKTGRVTETVRHLRRMRRWLWRRRGGGGPTGPTSPTSPGGGGRHPARRVGWVVTGSLLVVVGGLAVGAIRAPVVAAADPPIYLGNNFSPGTQVLSATPLGQNPGGGGNPTQITSTVTTFVGPVTAAAQTIPAGTTNFTFTYWISTTGTNASTTITFFFSTSANCTTGNTTIATTTQNLTTTTTVATGNTSAPFGNAAPVTVPAGARFCLSLSTPVSGGYSLNVGAPDPNSFGGSTRINSVPNIFLPERALLLAGLALLAPALVRRLPRRRRC